MDTNHRSWWTSSGHRANMVSSDFNVLGHHTMNDTDGGDEDHWATQAFARPLSTPYTHLFGLLYEDLDDSGAWTPRNDADPAREGRGGISFSVVPAGGGAVVASGVTLATGSYSARIGNGTYDVIFSDPSLPGGELSLANVVVSGINVDVGDTDVSLFSGSPLQAGDANQDLQFDFDDLFLALSSGKYETGLAATWGEGDWTGAPGGTVGNPPSGDGVFDFSDIFTALSVGHYQTGPYAARSGRSRPRVGGAVPEPSGGLLAVAAACNLLWAGRRGVRRGRSRWPSLSF
jgi:hypothetical protein